MTRRPPVLIGLALVAGTGLVFIVWDALASLTFEPTDASNFRSWADQPVGSAGAIALSCGVLGFVAWLLSRRHGRLLVVALVAVLIGTGALIWGPAAHAGRAHPEYAWGRTLASLQMPSGYASEPVQLDHPSAVDGPAATRLWTTMLPVDRVCSDVTAALDAWADAKSVRQAGRASSTRCYVSASKKRHPVDANVTPGVGEQGAAVSVRLGW